MSIHDAPGPNQDEVDAMFDQLVSRIEPEDTSDAWFHPAPGGQIRVSADARYLELFAAWCAQLIAGLDDSEGSRPVAYEDDPLAQLAYESGPGAQVLQARKEALGCVVRTVGDELLDEATADMWLRAANDLRMLMVPDDVSDDESMRDSYTRATPESAATALLGALQHYLLRALADLQHS